MLREWVAFLLLSSFLSAVVVVVVCGGDWPMGGAEALCHPFFGAHDEHVLRVPAQIQARLDEEENQPPLAVGDPCMADDKRARADKLGRNSSLTRLPGAFSVATSPTCFTR